MLHRRSFLTGLIAAPVVVRSGVLMPIRGIVMPTTHDTWRDWTVYTGLPKGVWRMLYRGVPIREVDDISSAPSMVMVDRILAELEGLGNV